jgi:hypothetical protein
MCATRLVSIWLAELTEVRMGIDFVVGWMISSVKLGAISELNEICFDNFDGELVAC